MSGVCGGVESNALRTTRRHDTKKEGKRERGAEGGWGANEQKRNGEDDKGERNDKLRRPKSTEEQRTETEKRAEQSKAKGKRRRGREKERERENKTEMCTVRK